MLKLPKHAIIHLHGFATACLILARCAISGHLVFIAIWSIDNFKEANIKYLSDMLKMNTYSNDFSYLPDCDKITTVYYLWVLLLRVLQNVCCKIQGRFYSDWTTELSAKYFLIVAKCLERTWSMMQIGGIFFSSFSANNSYAVPQFKYFYQKVIAKACKCLISFINLWK